VRRGWIRRSRCGMSEAVSPHRGVGGRRVAKMEENHLPTRADKFWAR
jgi:hypothetical protein